LVQITDDLQLEKNVKKPFQSEGLFYTQYFDQADLAIITSSSQISPQRIHFGVQLNMLQRGTCVMKQCCRHVEPIETRRQPSTGSG